jgi:hypothetical protein
MIMKSFQMELEIIMLSKISQTQKDKYCMSSLICESRKKFKSHQSRRGTFSRREGDFEGRGIKKGNGIKNVIKVHI